MITLLLLLFAVTRSVRDTAVEEIQCITIYVELGLVLAIRERAPCAPRPPIDAVGDGGLLYIILMV